jgi:transcription termination factor NusB
MTEQDQREAVASVGLIAGTILLGASSFLGCTPQTQPQTPPSYDQELSLQKLPPIPTHADNQISQIRSLNPESRPYLEQIEIMEKALGLVLANVKYAGWNTDPQLKGQILQEFENTKAAILRSKEYESSSTLAPTKVELFESIHTVQKLLETNSLSTHSDRGFHSGTNGNINPAYELQAQLMLTRIHLSQ